MPLSKRAYTEATRAYVADIREAQLRLDMALAAWRADVSAAWEKLCRKIDPQSAREGGESQ